MNQSDIGVSGWSSWLLESRGILLEHEGTERHGFLHMQFNIILVNALMKISLDMVVIKVKDNNNL